MIEDTQCLHPLKEEVRQQPPSHRGATRFQLADSVLEAGQRFPVSIQQPKGFPLAARHQRGSEPGRLIGLIEFERTDPLEVLAYREGVPWFLKTEEGPDPEEFHFDFRIIDLLRIVLFQDTLGFGKHALPLFPGERLLQFLPVVHSLERELRLRDLDPLPGVRRLRGIHPETPYEVREFLLGEERLHEPNELAHHRGVVPFAPQFVVDGVQSLGGQVAALLPDLLHFHGPPVGQSPEQR